MNMNTGITTLQNQQKSGAVGTRDVRVGARINARVATDLGEGKYILNLGGNETLYVESETRFSENEQVKIELRQADNGSVELKLLSRSNAQAGAAVSEISADSVTFNRELQLSLPTSSLVEVFSVESGISKQDEVTVDPTLPAPPVMSGSVDSVSVQNPIQSVSELRLLVERNLDTGGINSVKVVLPDGKQLAAELITGNVAVATGVAEEGGERVGAAISLKDAVFAEVSGDINSVKVVLPDGKQLAAELITGNVAVATGVAEEGGDRAGAAISLKDAVFAEVSGDQVGESGEDAVAAGEGEAKQSGLKDILSGIAGRFFRHNSGTDVLAAAVRAGSATMLLTEVALPLQLAVASIPSVGLEQLGQAVNITFPVVPGSDLLRELLAATDLILSRTAGGEYMLNFTAESGEVQSVPLPPATVAQLPIELDSLFAQAESGSSGGLPVRLGAKSLLQGVIQESLFAAGDKSAAEKSADILLRPQEDVARLDKLIRRCGLTPSKVTREAARALLNNELLVSRESVHSLLALSAGRSGRERVAFLNAGARLLSLDAPLSPPLAAGMSRLLAAENGMPFISGALERIGTALEAARSTLSSDSDSGEVQPAVNVVQNSAEPAALLSRAVTTLRGIPVLLEMLGVNSDGEGNLTATDETAQELRNFVSTSARERLGTIENLLQSSAGRILQEDPVLVRLSSVLDTVLSKLGNLPEELAEKPLTEAEAFSAAGDESTAGDGGNKAVDITRLKNILQQDFAAMQGTARDLQFNLNSLLKDIPLLGERLAHPGISSIPEFWERVEVDSITLQKADLPAIREGIEQIINEPSSRRAQELTRELLRTVDKETLRTLAGTLQEIEREEIQKHPALSSLREASHELRELGRALVAQKAENLAGSRNAPANFSTSIPFTFNGNSDNNKEGRLSMFYNRSKGGKGNWQQRVILDLNMSVLGNIIGDIQFYEGMINVSLVSSERTTVAILEAEKEELGSGLENLGFAASIGVRLLEPAKIKTPEEDSRAAGSHFLDVQA